MAFWGNFRTNNLNTQKAETHFIKCFLHLNFYPSFQTSKVDLCVESWEIERITELNPQREYTSSEFSHLSSVYHLVSMILKLTSRFWKSGSWHILRVLPHSPPHSSSTQHCCFRWRWCWEIGEDIVQNVAFWKQPLTSMHLLNLQANEIHGITTLVSRENKSFCISQPFANIHYINTLIDLECK